MKSIKTIGLVGVALAFVVLCTGEAAAQAPALTATANGAVVTIQWTGVPGATGYNLVVTGSVTADVNLPASITFIVVNAPAGSYTLRVRGTAGAVVGQFSNDASVTVGGAPPPGPCVQPLAPVATAAVSGGSVTISWGAEAGATGYSVQYSRFSGATELVQNTSSTSHVQYVGMAGTFYARVVATSPCGNATSAEVPFTITDPSGGGPRTPDPAPGELLPPPSYGQDVVIAAATQYRGDLLNSCVETGGNNLFMYRVLNALRQRDSRWGLNLKRGNQGLSQDIITYNPTAGPDGTAIQIYLWDIISGHCGSNPSWNWGGVTAVTWAAGQQGLCSNAYCARWYIPEEYFTRYGFR